MKIYILQTVKHRRLCPYSVCQKRTWCWDKPVWVRSGHLRTAGRSQPMNNNHVWGSSSSYLPKLSTKKLCDIFPHLYIIAIGATICICIYILALLNPFKSLFDFFPEQHLLPRWAGKRSPLKRVLIHSEYVSQPFQSASSKSNPDLQVIEVGIILSTSALGKFQKFLRKQIGHTDACLLRHKGARRRHRIHKQI